MARYIAKFLLSLYFIFLGAIALTFLILKWIVIGILSFFLALFMFGRVVYALRQEKKDEEKRQKEGVNSLSKNVRPSTSQQVQDFEEK